MFPVPRFGCITSNSAESLNSWMEPVRDGSHLNVLVEWASMVAGMFFERHSMYQNVHTEFPEATQRRLNDYTQEGRRHKVQQISDAEFEVKSLRDDQRQIVQLE